MPIIYAVQALVEAGIKVSRLTAVGFGETVPLKPHGQYESKKANRRVEFLVVPSAAGAP